MLHTSREVAVRDTRHGRHDEEGEQNGLPSKSAAQINTFQCFSLSFTLAGKVPQSDSIQGG